MSIKKILAAILAAALVVSSLAACGGSSGGNAGQNAASGGQEASGTAQDQSAASGIKAINSETGQNTTKSDETLVVELGTYPENLWHPLIEGASTSNEESTISNCYLDNLINLDQTTGGVKPGLATEWEVGENDITFTLRQGVKMTDGSEMTADDVVYSVGLWQVNGASNDTGKYITGVEKIDDTHVKISFNVPAVSMVTMLTWANYKIVSEDEINALGGLEAANKNPVMGCGKYRFKEAKTGEYIILERNEDYWDTSYTAYFKEIKFIFVSDSNAKIQAVQAGDAQMADYVPITQAATFVNDPSVNTYLYPNGEMEHIMFNMAEGHPTSDIRVRQAIIKCLNLEALAYSNTAGNGEVALSYFDKSTPFYVEGWTKEELARDLDGAKALLAEAGYDDKNPLTVTVYTLADQVELYTIMQANLREAGITLDIQQVDMGGFVPALLLDKSFDIVAIGDDTTFRGPQTPQFVAPGMCFGGFGIPLPDHEEILNRLVAAKTDEEAKSIAAEYNELLKKDFACINLAQNFHAVMTAPDIKGVTSRERGYIDPTYAYK